MVLCICVWWRVWGEVDGHRWTRRFLFLWPVNNLEGLQYDCICSFKAKIERLKALLIISCDFIGGRIIPGLQNKKWAWMEGNQHHSEIPNLWRHKWLFLSWKMYLSAKESAVSRQGGLSGQSGTRRTRPHRNHPLCLGRWYLWLWQCTHPDGLLQNSSWMDKCPKMWVLHEHSDNPCRCRALLYSLNGRITFWIH